jgi:hypothetical protein
MPSARLELLYTSIRKYGSTTSARHALSVGGSAKPDGCSSGAARPSHS